MLRYFIAVHRRAPPVPWNGVRTLLTPHWLSLVQISGFNEVEEGGEAQTDSGTAQASLASFTQTQSGSDLDARSSPLRRRKRDEVDPNFVRWWRVCELSLREAC